MDLDGRIQIILDQRAITGIVLEDYEIYDPGTGNSTITYWNEIKLGPRPTQQELLAISDPTVITFRRQKQRERELTQKMIQALAIATFKLVKAAVPTFPGTGQQFQDQIRTEWDNLT